MPPETGDQRSAAELPLRELLAEDFQTYERNLTSPGFWAVAVHRIGARLESVPLPLVRRPLANVHRVVSTAVDWVWGINMPKTMQLGRRVRIWHIGSMSLNARSIGNDVHIRHDTTFGPLRSVDQHRLAALPVIEDGVDFGSGACVVGSITVGHGAMVGANTVVVETVPPGATVFGVPARIIG